MERIYNVTASGQGNVVNVAEYMQGITNTINQRVAEASTSDDVKVLMTALAAKLGDIAPKLESSVAEQRGNDAKTLSQELSGAKREPWFKLVLESLQTTAVSIGEVGKPILEIVSKLMPLLVPTGP